MGHDRYKRGFGHAPETPLYPGDLLHVAFYWQANVQPRADWWFDLTLSDDDGHVVAALQSPLVSDSYATTLWQKGEVVRGEHDLQIPADLPPGNLSAQPDHAARRRNPGRHGLPGHGRHRETPHMTGAREVPLK